MGLELKLIDPCGVGKRCYKNDYAKHALLNGKYQAECGALSDFPQTHPQIMYVLWTPLDLIRKIIHCRVLLTGDAAVQTDITYATPTHRPEAPCMLLSSFSLPQASTILSFSCERALHKSALVA